MKKVKSNSNVFKKIEMSHTLASRDTKIKRLNSASHRMTKNISIKRIAIQSEIHDVKSKENLDSNGSESVNSRIESVNLVNTLKSHIFRPPKELNLILRAIPKYTARKVQDLKKGYKFTEDFDLFATGFLSIFGVLDEELGKELVSLRRKIGEVFTAYLSNSGRFFKLLRNLPIIIKKTEICGKVLAEALKTVGNVNKSKLSSNYQDLYDFLMLIINYFEKNNPTQKSQNSIKNYTTRCQRLNKSPTDEFSLDIKDFFGSSHIYQTYDKCETNFNDSRIDTSFTDSCTHQIAYLNPVSHRNLGFIGVKSVKSSYDNPTKCVSHYETTEMHDPPRSISSKMLPMKMDSSRCITLPSSSFEADKIILRNKISTAKRKEWDEIRLVMYK